MGIFHPMAEKDATENRHSTSRRRRLSTSTQKRVRWADEERSQTPLLIIVVLAFNVIFALLAVLSRWGLLWSPSAHSSSVPSSSLLPVPPSLEDDQGWADRDYEIRDINIVTRSTQRDARHAGVRAWAGPVRKRQTSSSSTSFTTSTSTSTSASASTSATTSALPPFDPLQAFQVDVPLLGSGGSVVGAGTPDGFGGIQTTTTAATATACEVTLVVNTFANSFGSPFVANYTPPACLGGNSNANTAVMNLTVLSQGRQFDRLFIL